MSKTNGPDKRRYLRYEILDYAVLAVDGHHGQINCVIADIGLGGMQLRAKQEAPVKHGCSVRVGCGDLPPLLLRGEILHCNAIPNSELFTLGIRFMPESHADRMAIAEYVHAIFQRQCDNLAV